MRTTTHTYSNGARSFEIRLCGIEQQYATAWTIESVHEISRGGRTVVIRAMNWILTSTEEAALDRACRNLDRWIEWGSQS